MGKRGVRFLPKGKLDKSTADMINGWIDRMNNSAKVSDNLLIAGITHSEAGIASVREFNAIKDSIKQSAALGLDSKPGLWARQVHFNPQVAGEVLKLAFTLNRSLSFCVHLLLLYGLESLADELATVGPHPPTEIVSASKAIAENQKLAVRVDVQDERDAEFYARNPNFNPNNRYAAHIMKPDGIRATPGEFFKGAEGYKK